MAETRPLLSIYYNPSCTKSQCAIDAIQTTRTDFIKRDYLRNPLTKYELTDLIAKLDCDPRDLVRKTESIYKKNFADKELSDEEWLEVLLQYPILLQRPIIVNGTKAQIARDVESLNNILK